MISERRATRTKVPVVGEIFELTLGEVPDPMEVVYNCEYSMPDCYTYQGNGIHGKLTRNFKRVQVGRVSGWQELLQKLTEHGKLPEGQWMEAYKAKYPFPETESSIAIADASWVSEGEYFFPSSLGSCGGWDSNLAYVSGLFEFDDPDNGTEEWLVEIRE